MKCVLVKNENRVSSFFVQRIRASGIRYVNKLYFRLHSTYMHCLHVHVHGKIWFCFLTSLYFFNTCYVELLYLLEHIVVYTYNIRNTFCTFIFISYQFQKHPWHQELFNKQKSNLLTVNKCSKISVIMCILTHMVSGKATLYDEYNYMYTNTL